MPKRNRVNKSKQRKKRHYPTEEQARYILDMREARMLKRIFTEE